MMQERRPGQGPQGPIPAESKELPITKIDITEYKSGIPLSGWESVATALHTFAGGRTREGRATQRDLEDNLSRNHGEEGLDLYLLATARIDRSQFVDEMLQEAQSNLRGDHWERHYDYDGMGTSFFKTTVEITRLPDQEDGYLLGLDAAYVGGEVEDGLAETLGVEQGLQWKGVAVTLQSDGDNFRIDFDQIANRLQSLYADLEPIPESKDLRQGEEAIKNGSRRVPLTGEGILRAMLTTDRWGGGTNPFVLGVKDGIEVSLNFGRLGNRFNRRNGNREEELWNAESAVLTGPLAESYEEEGKLKLEPPSVTFTVRRYSEDRYDGLPAIDPAMKATMNELASKIAASFNSAA